MRKEGNKMLNKRNHILIVAAVMAGALLLMMGLAGCGSKEPQTAQLALPSNPTTGYAWIAEQDPEIFDISSEYVEDEKDEEMVGVGGTETFTLVPKEEGSTEINLYYQQPWDDNTLDTRLTYQISVDSDMQITVESQNAEMPGEASIVPVMPEMVIK